MDSSTAPPPAPPADPRKVEAVAIPVDGLIEAPQLPPKARAGAACKLGIDEAGRGPVLGAMTFGCCYWAVEEDADVERDQEEINDSKQLTEDQRAKLFERVLDDDRLGWAVEVVSAARLSREMLRKKAPVSLNAISFDATCRLIQRALDRNVDVVEAYVDTVGDPDVYRDRLTRHFEGRISFTVAKKADALYKCTGAASICAKVIRDESLRRWVFEERGLDDRDFGSGYPSDPACVAWLRRNAHAVFGFPALARFSWQPAKQRLKDVDAVDDDTRAHFAFVAEVEFDEVGGPARPRCTSAWRGAGAGAMVSVRTGARGQRRGEHDEDHGVGHGLEEEGTRARAEEAETRPLLPAARNAVVARRVVRVTLRVPLTRTVVSEPEPRATSRAGRRGRNADDGRRRPGDRSVCQ